MATKCERWCDSAPSWSLTPPEAWSPKPDQRTLILNASAGGVDDEALGM